MKSKLGEIGSSARGLLHADGQAQPQPKGEIEMNELGAGRARFDEPTADAAPNPADVEDHREVDLTYFHPPNDRQQHAASTRSRPGQAAKAANIRGEPMERSDPIGPSDDAGGSDFQGDAAAAYYDPSRVLGEQLRDESNSYQPMQPCFDAEDIRDLLRYLYLNACPSHAVSAADVRVFESACVAPRTAFGLGRRMACLQEKCQERRPRTAWPWPGRQPLRRTCIAAAEWSSAVGTFCATHFGLPQHRHCRLNSEQRALSEAVGAVVRAAERCHRDQPRNTRGRVLVTASLRYSRCVAHSVVQSPLRPATAATGATASLACGRDLDWTFTGPRHMHAGIPRGGSATEYPEEDK